MKKNKNKNKIIILLTFVIIFLSAFYYFKNKTIDIKNNVKIEPRLETVGSKTPEIEENKDNQIIKENEIVSIVVLDKTYKVEIENDQTLYSVLKNLEEKDNNFSFNGKSYPSLGFFVDEINGVKNKLGSYWIYYINDKQASVGISEYKLKNGDIISWKLE
jgi:hypothetical protein